MVALVEIAREAYRFRQAVSVDRLVFKRVEIDVGSARHGAWGIGDLPQDRGAAQNEEIILASGVPCLDQKLSDVVPIHWDSAAPVG